MAPNDKLGIPRIRPRRPQPLYLREWLDHYKLDQDKLSERMGCSPGTVSKLLNDKMKQTPEWLGRFAYALDPELTIPDLYRHPDRPTQEDLLRNLPDAEKDRIIKAIRALTGT